LGFLRRDAVFAVQESVIRGEDDHGPLELPDELEVVETAPVMKTATKTASTKPARLSNGVTIQVPEFISEGERVRVNPREGVYLERAK
jgi:elongation factor P